MATDLRTIRSRIQGRLRITSKRNPAFDTIEIDEEIASKCLELGAWLPAPMLYSASAFTISANSMTFQLPTSVTQYTGNDGRAEYRSEIRLQLVSTGAFLRKLSNEQMDSYVHLSPSGHYSIPDYFSIYEEKNSDVEGRVWPGAKDPQAVNLWATMAHDDVRDFIGSGSDDMDDVQVQFSRVAALALEKYVAADLLLRMTDEMLKEARLNPQVAEVWRKEAYELAYLDAGRRHDMDELGEHQRWVS